MDATLIRFEYFQSSAFSNLNCKSLLNVFNHMWVKGYRLHKIYVTVFRVNNYANLTLELCIAGKVLTSVCPASVCAGWGAQRPRAIRTPLYDFNDFPNNDGKVGISCTQCVWLCIGVSVCVGFCVCDPEWEKIAIKCRWNRERATRISYIVSGAIVFSRTGPSGVLQGLFRMPFEFA